MEDTKRIVEINGVKVEVDLRTAKRVDEFKVGDPVKVLVKKYSDSYESHVGVIVGFDEFKKLPTLTVAYVEQSYSEVKLIFKGINAKSEDIEIAPLQPYDATFDLSKAIATFDNDIYKKEKELEEIKRKKAWFTENYGTYFKAITNIEEE